MVKYREPNKYDNKDHQVGPPTVTRGLPPPSPPVGKRLWSQDYREGGGKSLVRLLYSMDYGGHGAPGRWPWGAADVGTHYGPS